MGPHMVEGVLLGQKVFGRSHGFDDINCQGFIINRKTADGMLDHSYKFAVQYQLAKIKSESALEHSRSID